MMTNSNQGPVRDRSRSLSRLRSIAMIAVFDVAGPLVAYQLLRSAGQSAVSALVLSGILPALGIVINLVRRRRIDAVGMLVLAGIVVGTILGVVTHNPKLMLLEGSVPTAVFGLAFLGSLWSRRPLIYRFALEFMGEDSPRGREFSSLWQYPAFRHAFNLFTVVWGVTYLAEAAARVVLVELTSTSTALIASKFMPYVVAGALALWMTAYAHRAKHGRAVQRASTEQASTEQAATQQPAVSSQPAGAPGPRRPRFA
jgi:hypothetical protein